MVRDFIMQKITAAPAASPEDFYNLTARTLARMAIFIHWPYWRLCRYLLAPLPRRAHPDRPAWETARDNFRAHFRIARAAARALPANADFCQRIGAVWSALNPYRTPRTESGRERLYDSDCLTMVSRVDICDMVATWRTSLPVKRSVIEIR